MSEHWTIQCLDCEVFGPDLIRTAGRGFFLSNYWPRFHHDHGSEGKIGDPQESWSQFMDEHGYHALGLKHE